MDTKGKEEKGLARGRGPVVGPAPGISHPL
jgi:hypothetical protein